MNLTPANKPIIAAFDFDGTLTRRDTLLPFLLHTLGTATVARHALMLSPMLVAYALGRISNGDAKERVFVRCLAGIPSDVLRRRSALFAERVLPGLINPEAMQRLSWHKRQGHRCVLISASLDVYLQPWSEQAGFDVVLATQLEQREDGCVSGKLSGANCFGAEKVRRLEVFLPVREAYTLYAYGDSRGDKELLAFADYSYYRQFLVGE